MPLLHETIKQFVDASVRNYSAADAMLTRHPELRSARWLGEPLLRFLAIENFPDGVRYLASRGWAVDEQDQYGTTPLVDAVKAGAREAVQALLELGANPDVQSGTYDNALHCAIGCGDVAMVRLLLERGANPKYVTDSGETAFDALPNKPEKQAAIRALLIEHGVTQADV